MMQPITACHAEATTLAGQEVVSRGRAISRLYQMHRRPVQHWG
jgi:hypothetical protein